MMAFAQWLQATALFTALRESWYVYPVVLSLHLVAIALFGGLIVITDLRLLGLVLADQPIAGMVKGLRGLKHMGATLLFLCGILMFGTKAEEYLTNPFFHAKMGLLMLVGVHAMAFRGSVYSKAAEFDAAGKVPGIAKVAAVISLLLWTGLLIAGRGIGYVEPDLDRIHAQLWLR
jgi:uncharacterized membrane protein